MTQIVYGSELSLRLRAEMKEKIDAWKEEGKRVPCLAVILAGNNPASLSYVRGKEKACASIGMETRQIHLDENVTQSELEAVIRECNDDPGVDGILVQLPLPKGLNENQAILCIDPSKDVDGLHPVNVGRLFLHEDGFVPCTPLGIMEILKEMNCMIDGRKAVVIGRSKLVGQPVARLLQDANATVTVCHSHTRNLPEVCREADILVACIGRERMITKEYIKEGAYVVDVGINRMADGHLTGDVDFENVKDHTAAITPVPKGVGPMTICMLLKNTIRAYEEKL